MPRVIRKRRTRVKTAELQERARRWTPKGWKGFIDPYPYILGTRPEKMVYAYLMGIGIPFNYQTYLQVKIPELDINKFYRPDFIIPSLKLVIEVQGAYWHSQPQQIEQDAIKQGLYRASGYKVVAWWDFEIEMGVHLLASQVPGLYNYSGPRVGEVITEHKEYRDDSAGVRKANALRTDYSKHVARIKTRSTRSKSVGLSYVAR